VRANCRLSQNLLAGLSAMGPMNGEFSLRQRVAYRRKSRFPHLEPAWPRGSHAPERVAAEQIGELLATAGL